MMRRALFVPLLTCTLALGVWPSTAHAQSEPPRTVLLLTGYARVAAPEFKDRVDPLITFERAALDVTYTPSTTLGGGVGIARRLSTRFGVLADVSVGSAKASAAARGTLPHPLYFNRSRDVEGTDDLTGSQVIVDLIAAGFWQRGTRWTILAGVGPAFVRVSQKVVTGVLTTETFPYDTVAVQGLQTETASGSGLGVTGMLDVTRSFGTRTGLALFARYTAASVGTGDEDTAVDVNAAGLRVGLGLRFRW